MCLVAVFTGPKWTVGFFVLQFKMSICSVLEAVLTQADGCVKDTEGQLHTAGQGDELLV